MPANFGDTPTSNVLVPKDTNVQMGNTDTDTIGKDASVKGDGKTLEYHRQVLQSKMENQTYDEAAAAAAAADPPHHKAVSKLTQQDSSGNNYVSPSDEIMSPCTAKLTALRNKQVGKVKPRSLFAQASTKRMRGSEGPFGSSKPTTPSSNLSAI